MDKALLEKCKETVEKCKKILEENTEWQDRYAEYVKVICENEEKFKNAKLKFQINEPLHIYSCISKATKKSPSLEYDIRFCGQSVATLRIKKDKVKITTKKNKKNLKPFTLSNGSTYDKLQDKPWRSEEATKFRKFFRDNETELSNKAAKPEWKLESRLLKEFDKPGNSISPKKVAEAYFQMPTVFSASKKNVFKYSGEKGGGIDILATITHGSNSDNRFAVMELKDENKKNEPQSKVILQALKYATFLAYLLNNEKNKAWWTIFGKTEKKPLKIDVVTVMPASDSANDILSNPQEEVIYIDEDTSLHLYSLFFDPNAENFIFSGTLADVIKK